MAGRKIGRLHGPIFGARAQYILHWALGFASLCYTNAHLVPGKPAVYCHENDAKTVIFKQKSGETEVMRSFALRF